MICGHAARGVRRRERRIIEHGEASYRWRVQRPLQVYACHIHTWCRKGADRHGWRTRFYSQFCMLWQRQG